MARLVADTRARGDECWVLSVSGLGAVADQLQAAGVPILACSLPGSAVGGIRRALRMIHTARSAGLKVMLGCMVETSVGIAAATQLAPLAEYIDLDGHLLLADDPFEGIGGEMGQLTLTDRPGLGVRERSSSD